MGGEEKCLYVLVWAWLPWYGSRTKLPWCSSLPLLLASDPAWIAPANVPSLLVTYINESIHRLKHFNRRVVSEAWSTVICGAKCFFRCTVSASSHSETCTLTELSVSAVKEATWLIVCWAKKDCFTWQKLLFAPSSSNLRSIFQQYKR